MSFNADSSTWRGNRDRYQRDRALGEYTGPGGPGSAVLDYNIQMNASGLVGGVIYNSFDGVEQPLQYIGYPPGVTPPEAQALLDQGLNPYTRDFSVALYNALVAHGAAFKPAGVVVAASTTYVPPPPPKPVLGPETYLVNGVTYTNFDEALKAAAAGPAAPPASTTGVIHYDPDSDSYLPGPTPGGGPPVQPPSSAPHVDDAPLVDPIPTGVGLVTLDAAGSSAPWSTGKKVAVGAGVALGAGTLFYLLRRL